MQHFSSMFDNEHALPQSLAYLLVLATFALVEWSSPAVQRLMRVFPVSLSHTIVRDHALVMPSPFFHMMCESLKVGTLDDIERVISLHKWLGWHDSMRGWFPVLHHLPGVARIEDMRRILVELDIPVFQIPMDHEQIHQLKMSLMVALMHRQSNELMALVLDQVRFDRQDWARLLPWDAEKAWAVVQSHIGSVEEQRAIALQALCYVLSTIELHRGVQATIKSHVIYVAHIVSVDFGMDLIDLVLNESRINFRQTPLLFLTLSDSLPLPNALPTLKRILRILETGASCTAADPANVHRLCAMATVFFHLHMADHASSEALPSLSKSQLAILSAAVLVGTALADSALGLRFSLNHQKSSTESLVSHARHTVGSLSFADLIPAGLSTTVTSMVQELAVTAAEPPAGDDSLLGRYTRDPDLARWTVARVAELDSSLIGATAHQQV